MKSWFTYALLATALLATVANAQAQQITAATTALKISALKETQDVWANFVLNDLKVTAIRDMEFEQGHAQDNSFHITNINGGGLTDNVVLESVPTQNGFKVGISGLTTGFNA